VARFPLLRYSKRVAALNLWPETKIIVKISKVTPMVLGTEWRNLTIVNVETDEGLVGLGECRAGQS
jgi:L-alanine-DL-glutamate epimerase-like enolase superfamily enzyme